MSGAGPYRQLFTPAAGRSVDRGQPHRVLRPPHQLRHRGRPPERPARRLLRGPGRGRRRPHHHRGALHPPHRLALREAHPRLPPRGHPRLPPHHRGRPRPRRADPGPDQPQRRAGLQHVHPAAGVGAEPGPRPAVPGGPQGGRGPRDRRDRRRLRPGRRALHRAAASTASSCSARTRRSCGASSPPPPTAAPTATGGAWRAGPVCCWRSWRRCEPAIGPPAPPSACGCAATSSSRAARPSRTRSRWPAWSRPPAQVDYINTSIGVATATLYMIEASMQIPPGYAMFIPSAIREAVSLPVVGVGPVQGPPAGRPGPAGRPLRPGRRGTGPDRRRRLRGQGPVRPRRRHPHLPVVQPGVRRPHGAQPVAGLHREPPHRAGGGAGAAAPPRAARRRVVVVGGGPAGLQAAVTATERGHRVVLFERQARLGGQVPVAASVPSRAEFLDITRNLAAQAHRLGVDVRTSTEADRGRRPGRAARRGDPGHRRPAGPAVVGRRATRGWSTCATCWRAGPRRAGGWWSSTSWGSTRPRRWRSCSPTGAARSRS